VRGLVSTRTIQYSCSIMVGLRCGDCGSSSGRTLYACSCRHGRELWSSRGCTTSSRGCGHDTGGTQAHSTRVRRGTARVSTSTSTHLGWLLRHIELPPSLPPSSATWASSSSPPPPFSPPPDRFLFFAAFFEIFAPPVEFAELAATPAAFFPGASFLAEPAGLFTADARGTGEGGVCMTFGALARSDARVGGVGAAAGRLRDRDDRDCPAFFAVLFLAAAVVPRLPPRAAPRLPFVMVGKAPLALFLSQRNAPQKL
jgi:hypothetical protein